MNLSYEARNLSTGNKINTETSNLLMYANIQYIKFMHLFDLMFP